MTSLAFSVVLQVSMAATGAQDYKDAYHKTAETGQPLVVLVGADWCPGCRQMKNSVMPELEKKGALANVAFTCVNTDKQHDLAGKLMQGHSIPQLIVFRKTATGWTRQQMTGAHSAQEIQSFIGQNTEEPTARLSSRE